MAAPQPGDRVRAKRLGWRGDMNFSERDDLDPYDYEDPDVEGVLHVVDATGPFVDRHTNYLVNGQSVDPDTIEPATAQVASVQIVPVIPRGLLNPRRAVHERLTAAAGDEPHTGGMIALVPDVEDLERIVLNEPGAEEGNELHLTLAYLGDVVDWDDDAKSALIGLVRNFIQSHGFDMPVLGTVFGVNVWNIHGDEPSVNLAVGGADLAEFRGPLWNLVAARAEDDDAPIPELPEHHTPWVPHVCLAYVDDSARLPEVVAQASDERRFGPIAFDRVRVAFGELVVDIPIVSEP